VLEEPQVFEDVTRCSVPRQQRVGMSRLGGWHLDHVRTASEPVFDLARRVAQDLERGRRGGHAMDLFGDVDEDHGQRERAMPLRHRVRLGACAP
jgi:hypothetical protein